jgi:serine/threonine protein kinase
VEPPSQELVARIFLAALDCEPDRRARFVEDACVGNSSLREEVESLLSSHDSAGSFLETPPLALASEAIAAERASFLIGRRLSSFEIVSFVGSGGMGEVYRARDIRLDRTVAIKFLPPDFSCKPEWRQRLEQEALAISRLNHPNICTLYDIGRYEGADYLVLEYLEGETLERRLSRGRLPVEEALRYGVQIADALSAAHRQRITHRDVKPANIMLMGSRCKILDFGLAKLNSPVTLPEASSAAVQEKNQTAKGTILGTVQYMAPEQLEGNAVDGRTDIFAFGAVLYEMVTGQKAFQGKSQASLIAAIMLANPTPVSALQPTSPAALDHVIRRSLERAPENRWQTMQDVGKELQWILESEPNRANEVRNWRNLLAKSSRRAWIIGAITGTAGLAAGSRFFRSDHGSAPASGPFQMPLPDGDVLATMEEYGGPAVSPDGSSIILAVTRNGQTHLYLRPRDVATIRLLEGTELGHHPFWNPNGQEIGFFADGHLKTLRVGISGSTPESICAVSVPSDNQGKGGTWNNSGDIIFAGVNRSPLYRVRLSDGVREEITTLDKSRGEGRHFWPCFLPDQRHFLYLAWSPDKHGGTLYAGSLDTKIKKLILEDQHSSVIYAAGHLIYVKNGSLRAHPFDPIRLEKTGDSFVVESGPIGLTFGTGRACFSATETGLLVFYGDEKGHLVQFDREGAKRDLDESAVERYDTIRLSPGGEKLFYSTLSNDRAGFEDSRIRVRDIRSEITTSFTGHIESRPLVFSPDSPQAYFSGNYGFGARGQSRTIFRTSLTPEGKPEELLKDKERRFDLTPLDVSHDNRYLLILKKELHRDARARLCFAELMRDGKIGDVIPFDSQTDFTTKEGRFSPRGLKNLWVAYTSDEREGDQVYVQPLPPGNKRVRISTRGGRSPVWTKGGREIVFLSPENVLIAAEVEEVGAEIRVKPSIERFSFGLPQATFAAWKDGEAPWWDVTPDGQHIYVIENIPTRVMVVDNWTAKLKS